MGDDATNRWLFAGDSINQQASIRRQLSAFLRNHFSRHGYERAPGDRAADRSLVLGPASRWIWIGDSFDTIDHRQSRSTSATLTHRLDLRGLPVAHKIHPGSTLHSNGPGDLAPLLSRLGPVIKADVSDSAILSLTLFERGHPRDRYANGKNPFFCFSNEREAEPLRGNPEYWEHLLVPGRTVHELREAWTQAIAGWPDDGTACFRTVSAACIELLGLSWLIDRGYTWNPEGIPYRYTRGLQPKERTRFTELHFRQPNSTGRGRWDLW